MIHVFTNLLLIIATIATLSGAFVVVDSIVYENNVYDNTEENVIARSDITSLKKKGSQSVQSDEDISTNQLGKIYTYHNVILTAGLNAVQIYAYSNQATLLNNQRAQLLRHSRAMGERAPPV